METHDGGTGGNVGYFIFWVLMGAGPARGPTFLSLSGSRPHFIITTSQSQDDDVELQEPSQKKKGGGMHMAAGDNCRRGV
jgi:hypothetical protein